MTMPIRGAWYAGLCDVCGLEVLAPGPQTNLPPTIQLESITYAVPTHARFLTVRHEVNGHRIAFSGQDGQAYVMSTQGSFKVVTPYGGIWARSGTGFLPDGRVAWQDTGGTYRVEGEAASRPLPLFTYDTGGQHPGFSTTGFSGDPQLARNWYDSAYVNFVTVQGQKIYVPSYSPDGDWICGVHPERNVYLLHRFSTGELWEGGNTYATQTEGRLVMRDGLPVWVRSYPSGLVPFADFHAYAGEPTVPIEVPTFLPSRMGVGMFFDPTGPTICKADDARFPFISRERTPIVFCDLDKDDQAAAQRLGDLHQIPIGGYLDRHGYDPARLPRGWRAWIQCYPTGSIADTADAIQRDIAIVKYANRPFDLVVAMYCGYQGANRYTWTEQRVLDVLGAAYQLGNAQGAGALWGFARRRGEPVVDGTDFWLGLNEALRRIREASTSWQRFPQLPATSPSSPQPGATPSRWPTATPYGVQHMAVRGGLIGSGGFVGRVDPSEKKIHFDRMVAAGAHIGGHEEVEPRKLANGKWNLIYVAAQVGLNGAPKWECGTDLDRQFEVRPLDQLKGDEEWTGVVMPNGRIQFTVEHEANGQRFSSVPLTFVENR